MKIGIVVVWYNPDEDIVNNVKSYIKKSYKVYIVDNSDNSNKELLDGMEVNYYSLKKNTGIAFALNYGFERAIQDSCDWVITMDQDSYFENDIIGIYIDYLKKNTNKEIGILCPTYHTDRQKKVHTQKFRYLNYVMQSGNMVNVEMYKKVGKYEEKLFIDTVDYDYCFRLKRHKYKIVECSDAILNHKPAISKTKKILGKKIMYGQDSPLRYYYQVRNLKYLIRKYKNFNMCLILLYKEIKCYFLFDNRKKYIYAIKQAKYDYKHNIFGKKELKL